MVENSLAPMKIRVSIMKLKVENPSSAIGGVYMVCFT